MFPGETAKTTRASRRRTEDEAMAQSMEFKRQDGAESNSGETLHGLSKLRDICRNPIRVWIAKADVGENATQLRGPHRDCIRSQRAFFNFLKRNKFLMVQQSFDPRTH